VTCAAADYWCVMIGLLPLWVPLVVWFGLRPLLKWHDRRRQGGRGYEVNTESSERRDQR
jgi:hypothetical protein